MKDEKKLCKDLLEQYEIVVNELSNLEENEFVKKYVMLMKLKSELDSRKQELYKYIKFREFDNCNHILVYSRKTKFTNHNICGISTSCIKCRLDNSIVGKTNLDNDEQVMEEYILKHKDWDKKYQIIDSCDSNLAYAICLKIIEKHPGIDDKTLIKYFESALSNIRNNNVSLERKENRAKRLSLTPKFDRWNVRDIDIYYTVKN